MICHNCQSELSDNYRYCPHCGARVPHKWYHFSKYTWGVIVICLINFIYTAQDAYMTHQSNIRFAQLAQLCDKQTEAESLAYIDKSHDLCIHYFLTHGVAVVIAVLAVWTVVEVYVKRKQAEMKE